VNKIPPLTLPGSVANRQRLSKIGPVSTDRTQAQVPAPSDSVGTGENRVQISTYFTKIPVDGQPPDVIYSGDRIWTRVILELETAGPVAVGQFANLFPVLSGKGQLLTTGKPVVLDIAKGNKLYIAAQSVNRVKVTIQPYPWLETITGLLMSLVSAVRGTAALAAGKASKIG
jgi:hypothetical protein